MMQCLTDIVGVTTSDCACIVNGLSPEERQALAVSTSGLYLDNLEGGLHMKVLQNIDACKSFKLMATGSIENATKRLEDDLVVALNNKYAKSKKTYTGQIGRMSYGGNLGGSAQYQGLKIAPVDYSDAVATINKLTLIINKTQTVNVKLYRVLPGSAMGELLETYPMECEANQYKQQTISPALKLPMVVDGNEVEYWFVYDRNENADLFQGKDTKLACSTCEQYNKLNDFVDAWGVNFNSLTELSNASKDSFSHGLVLDLTVKCENETLFCREYDENDAISLTMAYAIWFKAGELLIEETMKTPDINRYTTMNREYLWGKRNHFRKEYETRILYLAETIDVSASNCYVCREISGQPFIAGIKK